MAYSNFFFSVSTDFTAVVEQKGMTGFSECLASIYQRSHSLRSGECSRSPGRPAITYWGLFSLSARCHWESDNSWEWEQVVVSWAIDGRHEC